MNRIRQPDWLLSIIERFNQFRADPRVLSILRIVSILYPLGLLYLSKEEIHNIHWRSFIWVFLGCVAVYYVSMSLQNIVWSLIVDGNFSRFWINSQVYFRTILMKRLPGGVWHWLGRSSLYELNFPDEDREISRSNFTEWLVLILTGLTGYATTKSIYLGIIGLMILLVVTTILLVKNGKGFARSLFTAAGIIFFYTLCWLAGGLILHYLLTSVISPGFVAFATSFSAWCLSSAISMVVFFFPSGALIRDFSLTALLTHQIEPAKVALIILQVRLVFLVADFLWSFLSLQVIKHITSKDDPMAN